MGQSPTDLTADPMAPAGDVFVHLHLHTQFSLLDGGNRISKLVQRVKELGMSAVAMTDHGNLYGAVEFYNKAREAGVKPILGIEAYVAPDGNGQPSDRTRREFTGVQDGGFHLVLLAENLTGWKHLLKLSSDSFINGFYYRPRMDKTTLAQWADGLIAINGHLGSSIAFHLQRYVTQGDKAAYERAREEAIWHRDVFAPDAAGQPRFFLELQRHETDEQDRINPHIIALARELDIPLVCDNDAHFLLEDDHDIHDTLCCISMGKIKGDETRLRYPRQLYVKSPQQMQALFEDVPEALRNAAAIAARCNVELDFKSNHAPVVKIALGARLAKLKAATPAQRVAKFQSDFSRGSTDWFKDFCTQVELLPFDQTADKDLSREELKRQCDEALLLLAEAGAVWRYGEAGITDAIRARLDRELKVLSDKSICAYFLIVWDFVNEARRRGIPANARGSGVGTMVGYCLGLSNACPVEYGLLFERFTDPDRSEYPDIDIDICQNGRQEIIEYVRQKYGYVAQIITFNVLKAKAAIRDVGRVYDVPLGDVDKLCKLVPEQLGITIEDALQQEPELRQLYDENPQYRRVLDSARALEGMPRHVGIHAAGVVIATQPLDNIIPLYQPPNTQQLVTQWDGPTVEKVGLLKMDFLGLRTLSIIERARQLIRASLDEQTIRATVNQSRKAQNLPEYGEDVLDMERLTFDDQRVLDLFRRGETAGVFQFESGGMRNLLMMMKPDRLEDLIAANALYRPGPMDLIPDYCDRKHGRQPVPRIHEIVDRFTAETYGIMVYQEQVMQIVHELGEIPLRAAYSLIKAISKKKQKDIDAVRPKFVEGAQAKGLSKTQADDLFELILKFAGYGFNKSHSTGYAIVAYQTAYLKTYFPVQYMAALLTYESVSTEKVVEYIDECKRVKYPDSQREPGVDVKPPDINSSEVGFTVVFADGEPRDANHGHIRFGLNAVKGVGEKAIQAIIEQRQKDGPFKSLYDFCERVSLHAVNRATMEALVKCGAYDGMHAPAQRAALVSALESAMQAGQRAAADRDAGQMNFFESFAAAAPAKEAAQATLPNVKPWSTPEMLQHEKSVLGFYVSSHPLDQYRGALRALSNVAVTDIRQLGADVEVIIGGMLTRVRPTFVKQGRSAGQKMAMITLEDQTGAIDGVVFSDQYAISAPLLETDRIVFIRGKVDRRREEPSIRVEEVVPIERAPERFTQTVRIALRPRSHSNGNGNGHAPAFNGELGLLQQLLSSARVGPRDPGAAVVLEVHDGGQVVDLQLGSLKIAVQGDLPDRINAILRQSNCCRLQGPPRLRETRQFDRLRHTGEGPQQPRLQRAPAADAEFCASIDRY